MIAPDDTTFAYLEGRPAAPKGADWERALERWSELRTDDDAVFDHEVEIDVAELEPQVTGRTQAWSRRSAAPCDPATIVDPDERAAIQRALAYMALEPGTPLRRFTSTASSSARVRTPASRICARPLSWWTGIASTRE